MELKEFIRLVDLNWDDIHAEGDWGGSLHYAFDINPEEFLEFANRDMEAKGRHALVNALSNAKKAIDCQVDRVLRCFAINTKGQKLPAKLELLRELGVVAPRIIGKVIRKRNYLEHEYKCPEKAEVEDAIDIARLFIEASNGTLEIFQTGFAVGNWENMFDENDEFKDCIYFEVNPEEKKAKLYACKDGKRIGSTTINSKDKEGYLIILKLALSVQKDRNIEHAIQEFIGLVKKK